MSARSNKEQIIRALTIYATGDPFEVRILGPGNRVVSGFFDKVDIAAAAITKLSDWSGVYFTPNTIDQALLSRRHNRLGGAGRGDGTTDKDILRRRYLLIDVDPVRRTGISATDGEHQLALDALNRVDDFLGSQGFPRPIICDSGNGAQAAFRIDEPADDAGLVQRVLAALAEKFNDGKVKIDSTVHNAARIWKLPGTLACKGDDTPDRPHRMARILSAPKALGLVSTDLLNKIAAMATAKLSLPSAANSASFDLDTWIARYEPGVDGPHPYDGGRKWILPTCPFDGSHTGGSAVVIQLASGAMSFSCRHDSCGGCDWAQYRTLREPGYHDRVHGSIAPGEPSAISPILRRGSEVERRPIEWLWPGRLAAGKINLLFGQPGLGKSLVVSDLAARVTRGMAWPDGAGDAPAGSVILASAEDDFADTSLPRFDAAGGDDTRLVSFDGVSFPGQGGKKGERAFTLRDLPQLADAIQTTHDVKLVILDPVSAFLANTDSHSNSEVRGLLSPLKTLAEEHHVCILLVTHLPKGASASAVNGAIGSIAFIAAARSAWLIARDKEDGQRRIMAAAKNNLGPDVGALAYSVQSATGGVPVIAWETDPVDISADELLNGEPSKRGPEPEARLKAEAWLADRLANGAVYAKTLQAEAETQGIHDRTLHRAADRLHVIKSRGEGGVWTWQLPADEK